MTHVNFNCDQIVFLKAADEEFLLTKKKEKRCDFYSGSKLCLNRNKNEHFEIEKNKEMRCIQILVSARNQQTEFRWKTEINNSLA